MPTQQIIAEIAGLQISNSTPSASPPGSLLVADNIIISQKGVAQPRNGQAWFATTSSFTKSPFAITDFQGNIIHNDATQRTSSDYALGYVSSGTTTSYTGPFSGVFNPVDYSDATLATGMKFAQASRFLNFCTDKGPLVLEDTLTTQPRISGFSQMPDIRTNMLTASSGPGTLGWMPYNSSVGYQATYKYIDIHGVPHRSPPSAVSVVTNRILAPVGAMVRGSTTVTVTFPQSFNTELAPGDTFHLEPGEANFPAGDYTVATVITGGYQFTYTSAGATASNTVPQDFNTGPRPVAINVVTPWYARIGDSVEIYRSQPTALSTDVPDPDEYLTGEVYLLSTSGFTYGDATPLDVPNIPLYTNPADGEGAGQTNFQPPIYRDITNFNGQTYYSNTTDQQSIAMEMLGVGPINGVQDGDTISLSDGVTTRTYTFVNTITSSQQIKIISDGLPAYNIQQTTQNMITTLQSAGTAMSSFRLDIFNNSAVGEIPGKFIFRRNDWGGQFTVTVSRPASWTPAFKAGTTLNSSNNRQPNGLQFSKLGQAEAIPPVNFLSVGVSNYFIQRIFGLRNALIICKAGDGIWSYNGSTLLQISNANIVAPNSACVCFNKVWVYTDQGYLSITDTGGVTIISRPIETVINANRQKFLAQTFSQAFAISYETERRIMFYQPVDDGLGNPVLKAFCYSFATDAWTMYNAPALCGVVGIDVKLYLGFFDTTFSSGRITQERKSYTIEDIADGNYAVSITAVILNPSGGPDIVELDTPLPQRGDGLVQGIWRTKIVAHRTDLGPFHYEVLEQIPWTVGSFNAAVYQAYNVEIQFLPIGNLFDSKVLSRLTAIYKPQSYANAFGLTTVTTDQSQWELQIPTPSYGFGYTPFGSGSFGNPCPQVVDVNPIANSHTVAGQFFIGFRLNEVWCKYKCQGIELYVDKQTGPTSRGGISHV